MKKELHQSQFENITTYVGRKISLVFVSTFVAV
jgi:hypothetical protein